MCLSAEPRWSIGGRRKDSVVPREAEQLPRVGGLSCHVPWRLKIHAPFAYGAVAGKRWLREGRRVSSGGQVSARRRLANIYDIACLRLQLYNTEDRLLNFK